MKNICVIGAGVMGHGIAQVAATAGFTVTLQDIDAAILEKALTHVKSNLAKGVEKGKLTAAERDTALEHLTVETDLKKAAERADLVIEAIPEKLPLKIELFGKLSRFVGEKTVLATNTSSLSVGQIAAATKDPARVVGMHFFNPPYILTLLELVYTPRTSSEVLSAVKEVAAQMKRDVIVVKDSPGFATSRLGVALGLEAIRMLQEGVASAEDIDRAMELGYRHPMGPLKLTDLVGLDTRLSIAEYLQKETGSERFSPPRLLRELVAQGKLGKKSGQGFYAWPNDEREKKS